jgi:hypothetical protein
MRSLPLATVACLMLAGCTDQGPPITPQLRVIEGDRQVARVGTLLPDPVAITVVDQAGAPLRGERVEWQADAGGLIVPFNTVTDQAGISRARWILGSAEGVHTATATLRGADSAVITAIAESQDALLFNQPAILSIATYDGSNQVVHPDYAATPPGVFGEPDHLAITPYPGGDARLENPSLFAGSRPNVWALSPGALNPVVLPPAGYLSDPDLVYEPDAGELWLYYRQVTTDNIIYLIRSADGLHWSEPVELFRAPNHQIVSPTVVRRGRGDWWMWSVNAGSAGCGAATTTVDLRRSTDGVAWSGPVTTDLTQEALWPWHVDVEWIPSRDEFWAVYNAKTASGCTTPAVFLASSVDGVTWQGVSRPLLAKGRVPEFEDIVYRSTFAYDPFTDAVTFWYSGARFEGNAYVWKAAVERRHRAEVFANLTSIEDGTLFSPPPAPLIDWP